MALGRCLWGPAGASGDLICRAPCCHPFLLLDVTFAGASLSVQLWGKPTSTCSECRVGCSLHRALHSTECLEISLRLVLVECLRGRQLRHAALMSACSLAENRERFTAALIKSSSFCVKFQLQKCCLGSGRGGKAPSWSGGALLENQRGHLGYPRHPTCSGPWGGGSAGPGALLPSPPLLCLLGPGWLWELCKEAPLSPPPQPS